MPQLTAALSHPNIVSVAGVEQRGQAVNKQLQRALGAALHGCSGSSEPHSRPATPFLQVTLMGFCTYPPAIITGAALGQGRAREAARLQPCALE